MTRNTRGMTVLRVFLAAVPCFMLSFAVALVNRDQPRIFGLPFIMAWIVLWVALTPIFLFAVERLRPKA